MKEWLQPYLKLYKGKIALSLFFGILGVGSGAMLLFMSGYLISKSALRPENIMIVYVPIVAVRAFSIGRAVFLYVEKLASHDLVLRILAKMRVKLYKIVEPQALFLRSRYQTGDLLGVLSDDIEHLQDLYIKTVLPGSLGVLIYGVIIAVFGWFDLVFGLMMLFVLGILIFLIPTISFFQMKKHHVAMKQQRGKLYQYLTDAIFGLTDWQASGRVKEFVGRYHKQDQQLIATKRKMQSWHYVRDAVIQVIIGVIIIMTMVWAGTQANAETIAPTVIAAFVLMMFSITEELMPLSDSIELIPSYQESVERIEEVENSPYPKSIVKNDEWQQTNKADLVINELSYRYPNSSEDVLKNISMSIPAGSKVAILGRSGAGKSTLLKLIAGALEPTAGSIMINQQPMQSAYLSKAVSVLNQKPHLFSTTIANNIKIGRNTASHQEVERVAEQAQLSSLIASLPDGMATQMLEMGHRFSGGERQRVAFARVLLQDAPIIIVDEATVGLDPINEMELLDTMLTATEGKTVLWITHHLAGVEAMDQIIFLEDGRIKMQGSHDELMATEPHYRRLYEMDQA